MYLTGQLSSLISVRLEGKQRRSPPNLFLCVAALLTIVAASLFALQTDDRENSFQVSRGEAFYIQVSIDFGREWSHRVCFTISLLKMLISAGSDSVKSVVDTLHIPVSISTNSKLH
jgi:hypothetical protein